MAEMMQDKAPVEKKWGRGFDVKKQNGFTTIAMICFVMLYAPILTLVVYSFNAGDLGRHLGRVLLALV